MAYTVTNLIMHCAELLSSQNVIFFSSLSPYFNWAFWEQVFTGGGGGGVNLSPPSDLGPEGADRREILHGCEDI